ncbi:MAG: carbohydrate kinase family protein [Thermoplasmatota archaeon]
MEKVIIAPPDTRAMGAVLDVAVAGNIVVDLQVGPLAELPSWGELALLPRRVSPELGGNGAIFAVAASRLGLRPALIGRVGRDGYGDWALRKLEEERVRSELVRRGRGGTATTVALIRSDGERAFLHHSGAGASLKAPDLGRLPRCRWFHMASMFLLPSLSAGAIERALRNAKASGASTSLDVAWDPSGRWHLGRCLEFADWFLPNLDEARAMTGERGAEAAAWALLDMGAGGVAIKMGREGSLVGSRELGVLRAPAFEVEAVDSTGAGDVFDAALVYGLLNGMAPARAALLANAAGAMSTAAMGGTAAAPTAAELLGFIRRSRKERRGI